MHACVQRLAQVGPTARVARLCGNMYTASLWASVAQVIETSGGALEGRRLLLFSYGSGAAGTLLSLVGRRVDGRFNLDNLQRMVSNGPSLFFVLCAQRLCMHHTTGAAAARLAALVSAAGAGRNPSALSCFVLQSDLATRLARRSLHPPAEFERAVALAARRYGAAGYRPEQPVEELAPGTFYLEEVDEKYRRRYTRKPLAPPTPRCV
jgi:hydroxymethylglutaryl-CoA synthase